MARDATLDLIEMNERLKFIMQQLADMTTEFHQLKTLLALRTHGHDSRIGQLPIVERNGRKGKHVSECDRE